MKPALQLLFLPPAVLLGGCEPVTAGHSPTIDVVGSYFPAWMVCIVAGLIVTLVVRALLIGVKLHAHLRPQGVVYPCLLLLCTLAIWLVFFQN
jgi:hypothetical protein